MAPIEGRHHGTAGDTDLIISLLTPAVIWENVVKCRGGEAGEICLSWCMIAPWRELTQILFGVILSIPNDGVSNPSTLRRLISQANTFPYRSA